MDVREWGGVGWGGVYILFNLQLFENGFIIFFFGSFLGFLSKLFPLLPFFVKKLNAILGTYYITFLANMVLKDCFKITFEIT